MEQTELDDTVRVRDGAAVWRELDGGVIVLALDSSTYLRLNVTASLLWPLLVGGATRSALIDELGRHFALEREQAARDVDAFLRSCREQRLLA